MPWRWRIGVLLFAVTAINYVDRQAMAVAAPTLFQEFGLTKADYGWITSGFLFAYAIGQALAGRMIDRYGTKRTLSFAVIAWSLVGMLHMLGRGFWSFLSLRAALGLFEGFNYPTAMQAVGEWFPVRDRALGSSMVRLGTGIGALISPPLIAWLIHDYGWQFGFLVPGAIGFIWLIVWRRYYFLPAQHPMISAEERAAITQELGETPPRVALPGWMALLRRREIQGLMAARFFADNLQYFYLFWLPIYLSDARGFSLAQIGLFAWIPFLFSDAGGLFVGWLSGRLIARGWSLDMARKNLLWVAGVIVPLTSLAAIVDDPMVAIALISFGLFGNQFKTTALFTLPIDLFPPRAVGRAWGLCGAAGSFGAMLFQPAIGWISQTFSYVPVFILISILPLLAAIIVSFAIPKVQRVEGF
jgi:ACS family hexuronate transporter-like MFS transporter